MVGGMDITSVLIGCFVFLSVASVAATITAFCSFVGYGTDEWANAHQSQGVWLALLLTTGLFGSVAYLVKARPRLMDARLLAELDADELVTASL